ncbi:YcnI family protein [Streptomyces sp. NPDC090306]|uniref:YcnI family copper-binding membrane protein n=1 Tax=Streptomyces sp. NPDC090306 TaxID=3365961 RepID=UPI003816BA38
MKASRLAATGAIAGATVLVLSSPAFAHVTVSPEGTAAKGGYAVIDFKVPNERDDASTTKVEVNFPTDHPLASVMPQAIDGWSVKITKSTLDKPVELEGEKITQAVTKVTWTADGKGIAPGYFEKFPVSVGALPTNTDELTFKALQTYSNKEVVRWIEVQQKGQEEPDNPAPVLELSAADSSDGHGASGSDSDATASPASPAASTDDSGSTSSAAASADDSDTTARVLGVVGIVVGVAGLAYGVLAGRRRSNA